MFIFLTILLSFQTVISIQAQAPPRLESSSYIVPTTVNPSQDFTALYLITNPNAYTITVWLGCSIKPVGSVGEIVDRVHDISVFLYAGPGSGWYYRYFTVPSTASSGPYEYALAIWSGPPGQSGSIQYSTTGWRTGLTVNPPSPQNPTLGSNSYISPTSLNLGQSFTAYYYITNPNSYTVSVGLGCSIRLSGTSGDGIHDQAHDTIVSVSSGSGWYSRVYTVSSSTFPGPYEWILAIWSGTPGSSTKYADTGWRAGLTVNQPTTVNAQITAFTPASGSYYADQSVTSSLEFKNTGNVDWTFWVGYTVIGPGGYLANIPAVSKWVATNAFSGTVSLTWAVPSTAPAGWYSVTMAVWKDSPASGVQRFDTRTQSNAFQVVSISVSASITAYSVASGSYRAGDSVPASLTFTNTGTVAWTFYVGYSVQDPNGKWWDALYRTATVNPGSSSGSISLSWPVDASAPPGWYNARVAVWKGISEGLLQDRLDSRDISNAFQVVTPPSPPSLVSPSNGAVLTSTSVTFTWSSVSGANDYQIEVIGPTNKLETVYSTSYTATLSEGSYTWRVRAHNSAGWSLWTPTWSFRIQEAPPPQFDFSLSASTPSATVEKGKAIEACTVTINLISGTTSRVDLSLSGLPSDVGTYTFSPPYGNPSFTSTLSIEAFRDARTGTYTLTITGSGGGKSHSTTITLTVTEAPTQYGSLKGKVVDASTGNAISGASVSVSGPASQTQTTGPDGNFGFELPVGTYTVTVSASGYQSQTKTGTVPVDSTLWLNFELQSTTTPPPSFLQVEIVSPPSPVDGSTVTSLGPPPMTFKVRVTCQGKPVPGSRVIFSYKNGGTGEIGRSDSDGDGYATVINLQVFAEGSTVRWWATADKSGYQDGTSSTWSFTYQPTLQVAITDFEISGSGQRRPALITVSFTVNNLGGPTISVTVNVKKDCPPCMVLHSEIVTLLSNEQRKFTVPFTEYVTGQHSVVVSALDSSGRIIASDGGTYVVGPITPGDEKIVIFTPDPFDATVGTLQIQNPDGSVKEIRVKKVQVQVFYPSMESTPWRSSLRMYTYVPVPRAVCIASALNPIPLSLEDMVEFGIVTLTEMAVKSIIGKSTHIGEVVTALKVVQCILGTEAKVQLDVDWQLGKPVEFYFALGREAKLEAVFEYEYFPSPDVTAPVKVKGTGEWKGSITERTDWIWITLGQTGSPSQIVESMKQFHNSLLTVSGGSAIALLVADPSGRRVGALFEDGKWTVVREIPNAYYSGIDTRPQYVAVPEPLEGTYKVAVTGKETGNFKLNVELISDGSTTSTQTVEGIVEQDKVQEHSAQVLADEGKVYVDIPWWVPVWDRYQFWFIGCLVGSIVLTTTFLKRSTVRRIMTTRRRRKKGKPKILDVMSGPKIVEVTSAPRILEIKDEE